MSYGKQFLYSLVKSGTRIQLNKLRPDLLFDKPNSASELHSEKQLYDFINNHVLLYRTLPSIKVVQDAGFEYTDTDQPPDYYLTEIKKRAIWNYFKDFQKAVNPLLSSDFNVEKVHEHIEDFNQKVSKIQISDKFKSLVELGQEIETQIEARKNGAPEVFVPFGFPTLDRLTGGLAGGDLGYFIARPGVGKTNILTKCAHYAWTQGFKPMVLTMEMTDIQMSRRIYGLQGKFNPDTIRRGIPESIVEQKLSSAVKEFSEGKDFTIICGQGKQTVESITALVDELQPDVLYIDAAYLVNMNGPAKGTWEKLAAVSEKLKQLAVTRNIPIIMTVQFNREAAKGKRYTLDTIAGSDAIGQLASVVVAITEGEGSYEHTRRILDILKNREGGIETFEIHNRFDPPDFSEVVLTAEEQGEEEALII